MKPYTFSVPMYPRSAQVLHDMIDGDIKNGVLEGEPEYVVIDICNLRNHLAAHLQRVALGDEGVSEDE